MATPLIPNTISGPFRVGYAAPGESGTYTYIGAIGRDGISHDFQVGPGEEITSDQWGPDTVINGVYLGANVFLEFTLEEAELASVRKLAYPFSETSAGLEFELGIPGKLWSAHAGELALEPVVGTPADAELGSIPARLYKSVILANGHTVRKAFAARRRVIPIRLRCLPYIDGSETNERFCTRSASLTITGS